MGVLFEDMHKKAEQKISEPACKNCKTLEEAGFQSVKMIQDKTRKEICSCARTCEARLEEFEKIHEEELKNNPILKNCLLYHKRCVESMIAFQHTKAILGTLEEPGEKE